MYAIYAKVKPVSLYIKGFPLWYHILHICWVVPWFGSAVGLSYSGALWCGFTQNPRAPVRPFLSKLVKYSCYFAFQSVIFQWRVCPIATEVFKNHLEKCFSHKDQQCYPTEKYWVLLFMTEEGAFILCQKYLSPQRLSYSVYLILVLDCVRIEEFY